MAGVSTRSKTFFRLSPEERDEVLYFSVNQGEYEGRLDVQFYLPKHLELETRLKASIFPVYRLGSNFVSSQIVDGPFGSDMKVNEYVISGIPLLRVSNCRDGFIEANEEMVFISLEKHLQLRRSEVLPNDVLLTKAGAILGYSAVFPAKLERGNITSHLVSIRPTQNIESQFLSEFLTSKLGNQQIYRWGNKSTRPELNTDEVRNLLVVVPPISEQIRLVTAMDEARSRRKQKLAEADALLSSLDDYLINTLGLDRPVKDERKVFAMRLQDIQSQGRLNSDYFHPERILALRAMTTAAQTINCQKLEDVVSFVRDKIKKPENNYLGLAHVQSNTGELTNADDIATGDCFTFQNQDVLFARLRPYLNKVYRAEMDGCCSPEFHVLRIRDDNMLLPDYLAVILRSRLILAQTIHMMTGNTHPRLTNDDVINLLIPIPNIDLQEDISKEVQRRRDEARRLRSEAETGWQAAKQWFEEQLLGVG